MDEEKQAQRVCFWSKSQLKTNVAWTFVRLHISGGHSRNLGLFLCDTELILEENIVMNDFTWSQLILRVITSMGNLNNNNYFKFMCSFILKVY
jgi:hypothetical protein